MEIVGDEMAKKQFVCFRNEFARYRRGKFSSSNRNMTSTTLAIYITDIVALVSVTLTFLFGRFISKPEIYARDNWCSDSVGTSQIVIPLLCLSIIIPKRSFLLGIGFLWNTICLLNLWPLIELRRPRSVETVRPPRTDLDYHFLLARRPVAKKRSVQKA